MLFVAAIVLIKPGWQTDLIGLVLIALVAASQHWVKQSTAARPKKGAA